MAKVTGPLFSVSASGKVADSVVFFGLKGQNVVRQWLKPANKMSNGQGDNRTYLAGTGKAIGKIKAGKAIALQLTALGLIKGVDSKQSYLVKYIIKNYLTSTTAYAAQLAAVTAHTASLAFGTMADALTIVDFKLPYSNVATYEKRLGLYLIAKALIANGLTGTPYTTNITAWTSADVLGMVNDFTNL
jgi:hypothetical protein